MITMTEKQLRNSRIKWFRDHLPDDIITACENTARKYSTPEISYPKILEMALEDAYNHA